MRKNRKRALLLKTWGVRRDGFPVSRDERGDIHGGGHFGVECGHTQTRPGTGDNGRSGAQERQENRPCHV